MNAQPFPYTHLSLPRYAKVLGINPVHFMGASGSTYWPASGACEDVWVRHPWQTTDDILSHEEIVGAIAQAEKEIATVLGYSLAPEWDVQHVLQYPKYYNPRSMGYGGVNVRGSTKSVTVDKGYIIGPGRRATTEVETSASVVYSDPDGDGWDELATIVVTTDVTEPSELHVYHEGTLANPSWEVRPVKGVTISGGIATITFDSWNLIDPDLHGAYPTTGSVVALDAESPTIFVSNVDVYRVYNDTSAVSVEFVWDSADGNNFGLVVCPSCGGVGCSRCALVEQDGCFTVKDAKRGVVVPFPASYDEDNGLWASASWTRANDPDWLRLYFYSGRMSQSFLSDWSLDPLDDQAARAIAWLATARMNRSPCSCANIDTTFRELKRDLTMSSRNEFNVRFSQQDIFKSPFGFRVGEVRAWQYVHELGRGIEFQGAAL